MRFNRPEKIVSLTLLCGFSLFTVSCGRDATHGTQDSTGSETVPVVAVPSRPINTGWDETSAGQFVILSAADDGISAALVMPNETDSSLARKKVFQIDALANAPVDLFGPAGAAGKSNIALNAQQSSAEGCLVWPAVRLITRPAAGWTVGFQAGRARSLQIDSMEALGESDSSGIATELVRQASTLSANGDPAFRGLPFIVRRAYRLSIGDTTALIGSIVRKINEEANPREEHLLLIVERSGSPGSSYTVAYQNRTAGAEADVRTNAILAAVRFVKTDTPAIVVSFEYDDGGQIALLERVASHMWKITWRSAYTGC